MYGRDLFGDAVADGCRKCGSGTEHFRVFGEEAERASAAHRPAGQSTAFAGIDGAVVGVNVGDEFRNDPRLRLDVFVGPVAVAAEMTGVGKHVNRFLNFAFANAFLHDASQIVDGSFCAGGSV